MERHDFTRPAPAAHPTEKSVRRHVLASSSSRIASTLPAITAATVGHDSATRTKQSEGSVTPRPWECQHETRAMMMENRKMETVQDLGTRTLNDADAAWIEQERKVPVEIAVEYGLHSRDGAICFPFHDAHGLELYCKHRTRDKRIWRSPKGTAAVPWGLASLAEATGSGDDQLVWTEGEFDKLAAHVAGEPWVVGVPDGAQAANVSDAPPAKDTTFNWLFDRSGKLLPHLDKFGKHVIAVDNDEKGRILRDKPVDPPRTRTLLVRDVADRLQGPQ